MFNKIKEKYNTAKTKAQAKVQAIVEDTTALSHTTEIVLAIVLVVAFIGVIFAPAISSWFTDTMAEFSTQTDNIFAFTTT